MQSEISLPAAPNFFQSIRARLFSIVSRETWINNFGLVISLFSLVLGLITYGLLTDKFVLSHKIGGFYWLLGLDVLLLIALSYAVGVQAVDVWRKRRQQLAGARLHIQLMTIFSALAVIPALFVTIFAITFVQFSVQSWFGDNIKAAVSESQEVAQSYLKEHQQSIRADMLAMASDLNREAPRLTSQELSLHEFFKTQAYLRNLSEAVMLDSSGKVLARAGISFSLEFLPENFSEIIHKADNGEIVLFMGENEDRVRALVKLDNFVDSYLFVGRFVDETVLNRISTTNKAVHEYKSLQERQSALKFNMTLIFALVVCMLLLVAVWTGLRLAERIVSPISRLIYAAELISEGDFEPRVQVEKNESEITTLAVAFNRMMDQLGTQRGELLEANNQLEERSRFIETVLSGVNAGIIGMSEKGLIQVMNASAERLLGIKADEGIGKKLAEICPEMEKVRRVLRSKQMPDIEMPIDIKTRGQETPSRWIIRMSVDELPGHARDYVATFDDLSPLIDAQRKAAWADVARRVAHEIKNPLTPIQLSAERLRRRYKNIIAEGDDVFDMCTETIIRQVDDIRRMVDEFNSFAKMPDTTKRKENMVTLCQQALVLFQQSHGEIEFNFLRPEHAIPLLVDRQQISQVLTNLLKNAVEAIQEYKNSDVKGVINLALIEADKNVILEVADNGPGWPQDLLPRLTDPYVTTKETGTGLGLAIVTKIIEDHQGVIELKNNIPQGAVIRLIFPKEEINNG